jgi:hypothetical protein
VSIVSAPLTLERRNLPSLIGPHGYHLPDVAAKLRGLARRTARHSAAFARIEAVVETPERRLLALDLKSAAVREAIADLRDEDVLTLFAEQGGDY